MAVYKDKNKTKDGRSWYFKVYKDRKPYKSKRYATKKEAQEEEALFLLKRDNPIRKPFVLVAKDYFNSLYEVRKESTYTTYINAYNAHIRPFFVDYYISDINTSVIRKWAEILKKSVSTASYLNKIYSVLKNIMDFAVKNYGLAYNPVSMYGRFKVKKEEVASIEKIRYITYNEFNKFISVIDDELWKTFFIFAYYTGCRKGEMQALTWKDIDFNKSTILINKTLSVKTASVYKITSPKTNKPRTISMSSTLKRQLLLYKQSMTKYKDFSNQWFVFGGSRFLPQTTIDRHKRQYFNLSGINEITMHEFRHSHVSLLINEYLKSGQTDATRFFIMMSERMGHTIDVMQKTYMHLFPNIQDEIVNLLDNL
ncbi:MAG: tyrosine-type recombinase/integrase [Bacilli bacterium]|nr:tyrosine-type recombinase/integrase [Bacilli bacterium]